MRRNDDVSGDQLNAHAMPVCAAVDAATRAKHENKKKARCKTCKGCPYCAPLNGNKCVHFVKSDDYEAESPSVAASRQRRAASPAFGSQQASSPSAAATPSPKPSRKRKRSRPATESGGQSNPQRYSAALAALGVRLQNRPSFSGATGLGGVRLQRLANANAEVVRACIRLVGDGDVPAEALEATARALIRDAGMARAAGSAVRSSSAGAAAAASSSAAGDCADHALVDELQTLRRVARATAMLAKVSCDPAGQRHLFAALSCGGKAGALALLHDVDVDAVRHRGGGVLSAKALRHARYDFEALEFDGSLVERKRKHGLAIETVQEALVALERLCHLQWRNGRMMSRKLGPYRVAVPTLWRDEPKRDIFVKYESLCASSKKLGFPTFNVLLDVLTAQVKEEGCLSYFYTDGVVRPFNTFSDMMGRLREIVGPLPAAAATALDAAAARLAAYNAFLKYELRDHVHVSGGAEPVDALHCAAFALNGDCAHEHVNQCGQCWGIAGIAADFASIVDVVVEVGKQRGCSPSVVEEAAHMKACAELMQTQIDRFHHHVVRACWQRAAAADLGCAAEPCVHADGAPDGDGVGVSGATQDDSDADSVASCADARDGVVGGDVDAAAAVPAVVVVAAAAAAAAGIAPSGSSCLKCGKVFKPKKLAIHVETCTAEASDFDRYLFLKHGIEEWLGSVKLTQDLRVAQGLGGSQVVVAGGAGVVKNWAAKGIAGLGTPDELKTWVEATIHKQGKSQRISCNEAFNGVLRAHGDAAATCWHLRHQLTDAIIKQAIGRELK